MTFRELYQVCAGIRYKPGFRLTVDHVGSPEHGHTSLRFSLEVVDAVHLNKKTFVESTRCLSPFDYARWNADGLLHYIKRTLQDLELHEVDEFLKYNGDWVTDPHPELAEDKREAV